MSNKVTINQGRVIPVQFRFIITFAVFIGMAVSMQNLNEIPAIVVCLILSSMLPLTWSSYYLFQVIPKECVIREGYWVAGIKKMNSQKYTSLEKIFINSNLSSQTMHSRSGQSNTIKKREFQAFLKTSDGKKYELISADSEQTLLKRLEPIAKKLSTEITKNY